MTSRYNEIELIRRQVKNTIGSARNETEKSRFLINFYPTRRYKILNITNWYLNKEKKKQTFYKKGSVSYF